MRWDATVTGKPTYRPVTDGSTDPVGGGHPETAGDWIR